MKTVEITCGKTAATGVKPPLTWAVFTNIYHHEGVAGVNKGVNAVAVRQHTKWGSWYDLVTAHSQTAFSVLMYRMGFACFAEDTIWKVRGKGKTFRQMYYSAYCKIYSSLLSAWTGP